MPICGQYVGSKELTEPYCWPEGLAHYLAAHGVRRPDEFVTYVESAARGGGILPAPEFDHLGQRLRGGGFDDEYEAWMASTHEHFRRGGDREALSPNWLDAEINHDWCCGRRARPPSQGG